MVQKGAETAAYLHLFAKFHEQDVLAEVLNRKSATNLANQKSRAEEMDAIIDIYNYAARFDSVPKISARATTRRARNRQRPVSEVSIELPEQQIRVIGQGIDQKSAEISAALAFKTEAEKYHAERGSESIVIKDSTALTVDNAQKFFEFYRIVRPGATIRAESRMIKHGRISTNQVQIYLMDEPLGDVVEMQTKKNAEETAYLTASIALKKRQPELYPSFLKALKNGNGQILRPVPPVDMPVDDDCALIMRETLLGARRAGLPDEVDDVEPAIDEADVRKGGYRRQLPASEIERKSQNLKQRLNDYLQAPELADLRQKKADLPMNQYAAKVLDLVNNNVYSIIVGATGSGKTTQVPQILLEEAVAQGKGATCNILCTQPRRIAAVSVARRVADERAERLQDTVGYHVRFDPKLPNIGGSVTYLTTGILRQQLQHAPDGVMDNISHLIVDEVHERDMEIDFLLIMLKKNIMRRRAAGMTTPKVVLMSATMDTELFASYFQMNVAGQGPVDCPSLSVPGRTFPVKETYLNDIIRDISSSAAHVRTIHSDPNTREFLDSEERFRVENPGTGRQEASLPSKDTGSVIDWKRERKISAEGNVVFSNDKENALVPINLVACTIAHIAKTSQEGAMLVFLPGLEEIKKVEEALRLLNFGVNFNDQSKFKSYMLHSTIPAGQNTVFEPVPVGCRKIILATNIAETSITIPDVQHVVDTGKLREKQYDQLRRITELKCTWISKSNSKQRAGRAGRVQNGNYYALFTKERFEALRAIGLPELLRTDLQEICLHIKAQAFQTPIREFLADAIEPPSPQAVDASVINLQALDTLTDEEEITSLGRLLALLPVHPTLGKMIVLGIIFRCLDPMLVLGAASSERGLFVNPPNGRRQAQEAKLSFVEGSGSDHIAMLNAVRDLRRARSERGDHYAHDFALRKFLHFGAFKTIDATATQIEKILIDAGLIPNTPQPMRSQLGNPRLQLGDPRLNQNSDSIPLIKALVLAGFHPNLAVNTGGRTFRTPGEKSTIIHPSSINDESRDKKTCSFPFGSLYSFSQMARGTEGSTLFLRDTTLSTPLMATLFGGKLKAHSERGNILELDNWLPFYVTSSDRRAAKTILEFRKALERLLAGAFKDLGSVGRSRTRSSGRIGEGDAPEAGFLADQKVRELFAGGLVEVLDRDVRVAEPVAKERWGRERMGRRTGDGGGGNGGRAKKMGFYEDLMKC